MSTRAGLSLIQSFESCKLTAYKDIVGIWTIGWGDTTNVRPGQTISQAEADARLYAKYDYFEHQILLAVQVPLNDNQLGALTSLVYNIGIGNFKSSTILKKLNLNDPTAVNEFARWNRAGGRVVAGLTRRRAAEAKLFAS